jgi:hypothetical protein
MRVFNVSLGQDVGGQAVRIKRAFDRCSQAVHVDSMCQRETYIKYPRDLRWDDAEAQRLYDAADLVHHNSSLAAFDRFDPERRKPAIVHHHGSMLRDDPATMAAACDGFVNIVSTVDLLADMPGATWIPAPFDLDAIQAKYGTRRRGTRLRIGHAPTNRAAKGTEDILAAVERLHGSYDFDFDLIENVEWRVCLSRKGLCHVFIDQVTLGYGCNAVEAMAMSIPVVSGWADPADREAFVRETGEQPPFLEASVGTLEEQLARLLEDADLRVEVGKAGCSFAERFHSEGVVVERLTAVYERALQPSAACGGGLGEAAGPDGPAGEDETPRAKPARKSVVDTEAPA